MGHSRMWRRLAVGVGVMTWLAGAETVGTQPPGSETVTFEDAGPDLPGCCAVPVGQIVNAAAAEIRGRPGILAVETDEMAGRLTVRFDPARMSRAELMAALGQYDFRPVPEPAAPASR